ncbi:ABC transporter ATP-binding protein [Streptomyces sp. NPDC020875]|uniref:ABC transporter ATP-binding protein n=1 Tax=Streptomyces sp. NPDC020875 TaxID=3154898 RepID=UPI0034070075
MTTGTGTGTGPGNALPVATGAAVRRAALRLIRLERRAFLTILAVNALAAAAALAAPWIVGRIVDEVRDGAGTGTVDRLALAIVGFALAQLLLTRWARYTGHRFGERSIARVREEYAERALAAPASVVERAGTGDLTARGTTDVATVGTGLRDALPDVLVNTVQSLFLVAAVFAVDPLLGTVGLIGLIGVWLVTRWYLRRAESAYHEEGTANSDLAEELAATATGSRTVEALGLQQRRIDAAETVVRHCLRTRLRTLHLRSVLYTGIDISYLLPVAAVVLLGSALIDRGTVTLGAVVAAALYLRQLAQPLDAVLMRVEQLQSAKVAFARVEGLGLLPRTDTGPPAPEPDGERIEIRDAHFAYDGGGDVVRGVELTVRPGEQLALVGPSGAGKTTLGRLLAGLDTPHTGSVTVGGVPVAALDPARLRRHIALVTQEHHIFLGTVRDNLRIAAPDADDTALRAALAAVGADWLTELPAGLDTGIGVDGHVLDGAQSQQLALARVVLADPHTLVLDEATALLDPRTARHTERALAAVLAGRTVIAVAHRLQTAHDADRVAVMEDGRLTELGTHDELVAAGGAYAALWHSWHGGESG